MGIPLQTFQVAVLDASESHGAARAVLMALLLRADYKTLTARPGRETLAAYTGLTLKSVTTQLSKLRASGDIAPLAYAKGGKGRATVYTFPRGWAALRQTGEAAEEAPETAENTSPPRGEVFKRDASAGAGWKSAIPPHAVPHTSPPRGEPSSIQKEKERQLVAAAPGHKAPDGDLWDGITHRVNCGENARRTWLEPLRLVSRDGWLVCLSAPTAFHADYVKREYGEQLLAAWQRACPEVDRLDINAAPAA